MPTDDQYHPVKVGLQIYPAKVFWLFRFKQLERGIPTKMVWENIAITYRTLCVCTNHCSVFANCLKTCLLINIILKKWFLYLILSVRTGISHQCFSSCSVFLCTQLECVVHLVQMGCEVNRTTSRFKQTPTHVAAFAGHSHCVEWLTQAGADINKQVSLQHLAKNCQQT